MAREVVSFTDRIRLGTPGRDWIGKTIELPKTEYKSVEVTGWMIDKSVSEEGYLYTLQVVLNGNYCLIPVFKNTVIHEK